MLIHKKGIQTWTCQCGVRTYSWAHVPSFEAHPAHHPGPPPPLCAVRFGQRGVSAPSGPYAAASEGKGHAARRRHALSRHTSPWPWKPCVTCSLVPSVRCQEQVVHVLVGWLPDVSREDRGQHSASPVYTSMLFGAPPFLPASFYQVPLRIPLPFPVITLPEGHRGPPWGVDLTGRSRSCWPQTPALFLNTCQCQENIFVV